MKQKNPDMIICLCGCMMQEPHVIETIKTKYRHVDIIFGTHNIYKLSELIYTIEQYLDDDNYDVLNNLLDVLQERNYYENYNNPNLRQNENIGIR